MLISPTEPVEFKSIGKVSGVPERHGCDFMILGKTRKIKIGVQRKKFPEDLMNSLSDNRLYLQLQHMADLDTALIILEGFGYWTDEGELLGDKYQRMTMTQMRGLLFSIMFEFGIPTLWVKDMAETMETLETLEAWANKKKHLSLRRRIGPKKDSWGNRSNRMWACHMLQGVDGIGPDMAEKILDANDGFPPLTWTMSADEFLKIPGIGKVTVEKMMKALDEQTMKAKGGDK